MKTNDFVKVCRQRGDIENQINQMRTKEVIELKADLKRKISGSSNMISLLIFEVTFFLSFLTLVLSAMGKTDHQTVGSEGAIFAFFLFVVAIVGSLVSVWRKSNHEEALSYLEDYLQEKNKKANDKNMIGEYKSKCARYEVEDAIVNWERVRENAERQIKLYQSLLTGLLEEKEEG